MRNVLLCVFALCAVAFAFPRNTREEAKEDADLGDTEVVIVPLQRGRRPPFSFGLSDDLVPPPAFEHHPFFRVGGPWGSPAGAGGDEVNDFMTQMQDMLKEMRKQLTDLVQHHQHHPDGTEVGTRIGDDDLPQNKSTSTTKVIDGHVVTVNETTYSSGDDNIGAVFRIKVVEVKPSESPEDEAEPVEGSPEIEDKSGEPRAPEPTTSKSELEEDKHEETNEIPNQKVRYEWSDDIDPSFNEIEDTNYFSEDGEEFLVDRFTPNNKQNYYDLSSDTDVNDYMSDHAERQGLVMIDPDAELIQTGRDLYYHYDRVPQRLQRFIH